MCPFYLDALDWQAVDAIGTWFVGLAAAGIALMAYRREERLRKERTYRQALVHITHQMDLRHLFSERLKEVKDVWQILRMMQFETSTTSDGWDSLLERIGPSIAISFEAREAAAHIYPDSYEAKLKLDELRDMWTRNLELIQDPASGSIVEYRGDFNPQFHATYAAKTALENVDRGLGMLIIETRAVIDRGPRGDRSAAT